MNNFDALVEAFKSMVDAYVLTLQKPKRKPQAKRKKTKPKQEVYNSLADYFYVPRTFGSNI